MELAVNNKRSDSLLITNYKSSDPYIADADTEFQKKKAEDRKKLNEEIQRRTISGQYNV